MKKIIYNLLILIWFILVIGFTTVYLSNGNKIVYYVVTIALIVIPTQILNRMRDKRKKD